MSISVCLAGATGWAGSALARAIAHSSDLAISAGVARRHVGRALSDVLVEPRLAGAIFGTVSEALQIPCDVFVEYSHPSIAKQNILTALQNKCHVVVGTSGLTEEDFEEVDREAKRAGKGVLACGNFALTAALLQKFAEYAAKYLPYWEIVDFGSELKADVPSGTSSRTGIALGEGASSAGDYCSGRC